METGYLRELQTLLLIWSKDLTGEQVARMAWLGRQMEIELGAMKNVC